MRNSRKALVAPVDGNLVQVPGIVGLDQERE
jgi:hypothetical protein